MSYENSAGLGVNNHYGVRDTQDGIVGGGKLESSGSVVEAVVYVKAADFTVAAGVASFDTQLSLPAGAVPLDCLFDVSTAFTQTGGTTSTTLNVGTSGSAGTNGFTVTEAATSLAAVVEVDAAGDGTWAGTNPVSTSAATTVGVDIVAGGGTITSIDGGDAKIVIRYRKQ